MTPSPASNVVFIARWSHALRAFAVRTRALPSWASVALGLSRHRGAGRRDLVADVPQVFVEPMLHALLQHFHWRPHGADDAAADDALRELQVVEAEQLHALVEIDQPLGDIVQTEEFFVAAIKVVRGDAGGVSIPPRGE